MSYGQGAYGQHPYGGSSLESGGPTLVSSVPNNGATDVSVTASVTFTIDSPAGLDINLLDVDLDSAQAIAGGFFQSGFAGTIVEQGTSFVVTITTHPNFGGVVPVAITIKDLAGISGNLSFSFLTEDVNISETPSLAEALATPMAFWPTTVEAPIAVSDSVAQTFVSKNFVASIADGKTLDILVPYTSTIVGGNETIVYDELDFDGVLDVGNYRLRPKDVGYPAIVESVVPDYEEFQSGTEGLVIDARILELDGAFVNDHIGSYLHIEDGTNSGLYQITAVLSATKIQVNRDLIVADRFNKMIEGVATITTPGANPIARLIGPTVGDPLQAVLYIENRTTRSVISRADIEANPGWVTIVDHETIQVTKPGFTAASTDRLFVQARLTPAIPWSHRSGVRGLELKLGQGNQLTLGQDYELDISGLRYASGLSFKAISIVRVSAAAFNKPRVVSATFLPVTGTVLVAFDQAMRVDDDNLLEVGDYTITHQMTLAVTPISRVWSHSPTTVALETIGFTSGDYTLAVSTNTPKDVAGNPIDPVFNSVIFSAAAPETDRSIFTDKGPIAKPPLTVQSGSGATLNSFTEVTLPGATLTSSNVGQYLSLSGGAINGGTFRISAVISATKVRLSQASFTLPDPDSGSLAWEVFDPRNGQIADDPADVTVRVNNVPVVPEAVIGLMGQIVLPSAPGTNDDVKVDYSWICNPTVDLRRLNSREFRLNAWNRDVGYATDGTGHKYRYNNVLVRPFDYVADDMAAKLGQPLERELHYRAYERAYTPVFNDPSLLLFNSPTHRIAYPPSERAITEEFVSYEANGLPEVQALNPWSKHGSGIASTSMGQLIIQDDASGTFPTGKPLFWTRPIDLTFPNAFALSWRCQVTAVPVLDGVFSGVAAGYSNELVAVIVGYLEFGGVKKLGILKRGFADDPSGLSSWTGGLLSGNPTNAPIDLDWSVPHSYRIFSDRDGVIRVYLDGEVVESLRVSMTDLPYLEELAAPFDQIQGVFFGAVSRPAKSTSSWDFVRYLTVPIGQKQSVPSSFVSYEANETPEVSPKPWTPVGYHGTETILGSDFLLLDATSATDVPTATEVGLLGGDYRGFFRHEPLLRSASEFVVDANVQLLTNTHGVSPYGLMVAIDDGQRLTQLSFLADRSTPKLSYGGRSLPEDFQPYAWQTMGMGTAQMVGRVLRISDTAVGDGKVYFIEDTAPSPSDDRVVGSEDYIVEFRCRVNSYTVDGSGFAGIFAHAYDSTRSVGVLFQEIAGVKYVSFHSDGVALGAMARVVFDWSTGFHTYRFRKSAGGNLVSLFIDGAFVLSFAYNSFTSPMMDPIGQVSFGSSTPASAGALSNVDWSYVNAWRVRSDLKHYVGIWKGHDDNTLIGYHLPLKANGRNAQVTTNALGDITADFVASGVAVGDYLIVDDGPNRGVYTVAGVGSPTSLTILGTWPSQPSLVDYRVAKETDWTALHKYRLARDSSGDLSVLVDADTDPILRVGYNSIDLPASGMGIAKTLANGLASVSFGSFDAENLAQSYWGYVRYGITSSPTELRIVPHHQVLNQWNVMHSPERLFTALPHTVTGFKSSSTGIVPKVDPDFMADAGLVAFTKLNQSTPLVPKTQSYETSAPYPVEEFVSAFNRPEDVFNSDGDFVLNDNSRRFKLIVPDDVLYSSLDVIEQEIGDVDLLAPFADQCGKRLELAYQKEVCLTYDGSVLPENDSSAGTPWLLESDDPAQVSASAFMGLLTYSTGAGGTKTIYKNNTPLPDAPGLETTVSFRVKVLNDTTGGTGDSQIRLGLSAPGMTLALAFITTASAERYVLLKDMNNGNILGSATFDFLDGNFHTYKIVRRDEVVQVLIDP